MPVFCNGEVEVSDKIDRFLRGREMVMRKIISETMNFFDKGGRIRDGYVLGDKGSYFRRRKVLEK